MAFKEDVLAGLSAEKKFLQSKYFYDEVGDKIFQDIMKMPEYYLTGSEFEIITTKGRDIISTAIPGKQPYDLIEFGAGDGYKTKVLIRAALAKKPDLRYIPIDISENVLQICKANILEEFPDLQIESRNNDYFTALEKINSNSDRIKLILFLGSNIGNFTRESSLQFLNTLNSNLRKSDKVLIGFDLMKNPKTIIQAYNDSTGHTKAFNLNVLTRINRELGGNFDIHKFDHYPFYDPEAGTAKSFLVSLEDQEVKVAALDKSFYFQKGETIHTEISQKFSYKMIEELASSSGFEIVKNFADKQQLYVNSLWTKQA